jgi:hypothetical protein
LAGNHFGHLKQDLDILKPAITYGGALFVFRQGSITFSCGSRSQKGRRSVDRTDFRQDVRNKAIGYSRIS